MIRGIKVTECNEVETTGQRHGILLVDDSNVMRRILADLCEDYGYEVVGQAIDGLQAISLYQSHQPLIVLMDINMPNLDGLEATRKIIEINPDAKIIIISANNERDIVLDAVKAGACGYIIKPVNPMKLIKLLNEIFATV